MKRRRPRCPSRSPRRNTSPRGARSDLAPEDYQSHRATYSDANATDPRFVFLKQLNVTLSHVRIDDVPLEIRRNEEMLDHAVRAEQIKSIQKQLGIA